MDLKQLERFVATAEAGTIGSASDRLGLSQPALTRSINMLEVAIGAPLFDRLPRGVRLTAIGQVLLPQAQLILRDRARLARTVEQFKGISGGSLAFGVSPNLEETIGLEAVLQFTQKYPKISVTIHSAPSAELIAMLQDGRLELALATVGSERVADDVTLEPLFEQMLSIVVGGRHPLAESPFVSFEMLSAQKWIVANASTAMEGLRRTFEARGVEPPFFNIRCQSLNLQRKLLLSGQYVAILDQEVVRQDLESGAVKVVSMEGEGVLLRSGLLYRCEDARAPAANALANLIRHGAHSRQRPNASI